MFKNTQILIYIFAFFLGLQKPLLAAPPVGIQAIPFYDQTKITWPDAKICWMGEVPGLPDHFYVLDMLGKIYSLYPKNNDYSKTLLADFSSTTFFNMVEEKGAFGMAFHPKFMQNKKLYLAYHRKKISGDVGNGATIYEEWQATGVNLDTIKKLRTILDMPNTGGFATTCINFGPDGFLYISNSDYGYSGQDLTSLRRKLLRIDIDKKENGKEYGIPSDNPYVNSSDINIKKEIYASGFRNPWRFTIDPLNGDIWLGDVGQVESEELNLIQKGGNYGWAGGGDGQSNDADTGFSGPCLSPNKNFGNRTYNCSKFIDPAFTFYHDGFGTLFAGEGFNCIVSGQVVRGDPASPFYGYILLADMVSDRIVAFKKGEQPIVVGDVSDISNKEFRNGIVHFTSTANGNLYVCFLNMFGDQHIYKLTHPQLRPATLGIAKSRSQLNPDFPSSYQLKVNLGFGNEEKLDRFPLLLNGKKSVNRRNLPPGIYIQKKY